VQEKEMAEEEDKLIELVEFAPVTIPYIDVGDCINVPENHFFIRGTRNKVMAVQVGKEKKLEWLLTFYNHPKLRKLPVGFFSALDKHKPDVSVNAYQRIGPFDSFMRVEHEPKFWYVWMETQRVKYYKIVHDLGELKYKEYRRLLKQHEPEIMKKMIEEIRKLR
jgi:hypothetical protein